MRRRSPPLLLFKSVRATAAFVAVALTLFVGAMILTMVGS
jgi:hypothetical protein